MDKANKPEYSFIYNYVGECFDSNNTCISTKIMQKMTYAKYEKIYLNKVMTEKLQHVTIK